MHTLLDLRGNIPTFIRITAGKTHDVNIDEFLPEAGAFYVMDRAISNASSCSARRTSCSNRRYRIPSTNPRACARMILTAIESAKCPDSLRRVSYFDAATNKRLKFLTNNFALPAQPSPSTMAGGAVLQWINLRILGGKNNVSKRLGCKTYALSFSMHILRALQPSASHEKLDQGTTRSVKYDSKKQAFFQPDPHEMWGWAASTIEDQLYMGGKNNVSVVKRTKATSGKRGWSTIGVPFVGLAGRKYIISTHFVLGSYADARRVPTSSAGVISGASAKIDLKVGFPRP